MKSWKIAAAAMAAMICLCACGAQSGGDVHSSELTEEIIGVVSSEVLSESMLESDFVQESDFQNLHSPLYLDGYTQDEVVRYFKEVVLDTEYSTGDGDFTLVQKWEMPIRYRIYGEPTAKDLDQLTALFAELNTVNGFPGIEAAKEGYVENLRISFLDEPDYYDEFGEFVHYEPSDGAVQYWYGTDSNDIYDARIGYRTDIDQSIRDSVLLEEIVNGLGIDDTETRTDSIVYQYGSDATVLSEIDWLIIRLMYHPDIRCGMNAEECEQVVRSLYY